MTAKLPWGLWWTQILAILRLEMKKNFARKRSIPVYLLAASPIVLYAAHSSPMRVAGTNAAANRTSRSSPASSSCTCCAWRSSSAPWRSS